MLKYVILAYSPTNPFYEVAVATLHYAPHKNIWGTLSSQNMYLNSAGNTMLEAFQTFAEEYWKSKPNDHLIVAPVNIFEGKTLNEILAEENGK